MNVILLGIGLLFAATAVTLARTGQRCWLMAVTQGLGVQALVAMAASALQVGQMTPAADAAPFFERVRLAVEGIPFNVGGWSAMHASVHLQEHMGGGAIELATFLMIVGAQAIVIALIFARRLMRAEAPVDLPILLLIAFVGVNSLANLSWQWWC